MKTGLNQFVQLWMVNLNNDLWQSKDFLSECLKEFVNCQCHPRDSITVQYYFYPRTAMVCHPFDSKHYKLWKRNLSWNTFSNQLDSPRVLAYINIRLSSLHFSLQKDIINHRDILFISFFNNNICSFIMNVYSDSSHSALKYLMDTEINIYNLLIMTGNFNIRDSLWDPSFPYHLSISNDLIIIADSFNLELSLLTNPILTRYSDTEDKSNLVINLMLLWSRSIELNNYSIHPNLCLLLDHTPLTVSIPIAKENIHLSRLSILKYSEEEAAFVKKATTIIKNLNTFNLTDHNRLEDVVNLFVLKIKQAWVKNTKWTNVMKHSKE